MGMLGSSCIVVEVRRGCILGSELDGLALFYNFAMKTTLYCITRRSGFRSDSYLRPVPSE